MADKEPNKTSKPNNPNAGEPEHKQSPYEGPISDTSSADVDDKPSEDDSPEEAASRSTAEFVENVEPIQRQRKKSRFLKKAIIIILVLALIAGAGYFAYLYLQDDSDDDADQSGQGSSQMESESESEPEAETIEQYASTDFSLSFNYPSSWQVDDSEQGILKVESPTVKLPSDQGQEVDAKVVITIVPSSGDMDFPDDEATAVRESEKFVYDNPAEGQREETFLSFMNIDGPSEGLNAVYITGDNSYVKGDPVRKADFDSVEPIIGVRFVSNEQEVTIAADAWDNNSNLGSAFTILKSLNLQ